MKLGKIKHKQDHVMPTKYGMGDNYGTAIKAKIGTMRSGTGQVAVPTAKIKKPPKSLA